MNAATPTSTTDTDGAPDGGPERTGSTITITGWSEWAEQLFGAAEGTPTLTRTSVRSTYAGDITGESVSEGVMVYLPDGTARYTGLERITGTIGGRSGSVVVEARGVFAEGTATTTLTVVPGSGSGELAGIRGSGGYVAGARAEVPGVRLDYSFE